VETILLVILIILALALIAVVLIQRSEGGALGMGGGPGGLFSTRGTANLLTRVTAGLAAAFMILSLVLVILEGGHSRNRSVMDVPPAPAESGAGGTATPATAGTPAEGEGQPEEPKVPVGATESATGEEFNPESAPSPAAQPAPTVPQTE
jgi:preprotein translocase subunit SecG